MATFESLKVDALRGYRERQMVTGTVGSFSTTFIQDTTNRTEPDGEFDRVDSYIKMTGSGPNLGTERRITGWSSGNSTVSFAAVPSLAVGLPYRITKTFTDAEQGLAVNSALRDSFPNRIIESFATAAETQDSYRLAVPSAAAGPQAELVRVERSVGTTGSDYNFDILEDGTDYVIEQNGGLTTLILANIGASGYMNRFVYRRPAAELVADTDTTDEPAHLIVLGARKFLALAEGDAQSAEAWSQMEAIAKQSWTKNRAARVIKYPHINVN
jgi:hypothetical protein